MDFEDTKILGRLLNIPDPESDADAGDCPQPKGAFPAKTPVAMAYVPFQMWETPYDTAVALNRGTIFPSLDKPFIGEEAVRNG